ncbi:MAG: 50S ribosomal protein L13 [Candidatus Curtissbacteria bacterium GW2011_GWA1_40_16]|uniref:Large ribosomal subunit protein uL13 n=1 Tax=Candidatus Curtissbacteria bacterium GW2011_GWA1_40_16 TaxID=1618405 RepID=A0A0G0R9Z1_9BACT|nr:MAG: 50S ribosomal protein L13 [Candidatus Curtissbacteria bacterium GW2011_GWA1_40_16]
MKTITPKDIKREWHLIDAKTKILGRLSSEVAMHLMGKNKNIYSPNLDTGDYVVVINAQKIVLSGKKEKQKKYYHHSGYPGGLYMKTAAQIRSQKPEELIRNAITGMLPKTKMGKIMLKKLHIFPDSSHPYKDKFKN